MSEPSGNILPSVRSAPAPTRQPRPIFAPLRTIAPMPTSEPSPIAQPCRMALCPIVQSSPMKSGKPISVCRVQPSWIFVRAPIDIVSLSPRSVAPNQTPQSSPKTTSPMTQAFGRDQIAILGRQSRPAVVKCVNRHDGGSGEGRWILARMGWIASPGTGAVSGARTRRASRAAGRRSPASCNCGRKSGHARHWSVPGQHKSRGRSTKN